MKPYAIFDLDGCLSDDRWRLIYIDHAKPDPWVDYHAKCDKDQLMSEKLLALAKDCELVIFTTRPESVRARTVEWLKSVAKIEPRHIFMRPEGSRLKSPELKEQYLAMLLGSGITPSEIIMAADDRDDVLKMYAEWGIAAIKTRYPSEVNPNA